MKIAINGSFWDQPATGSGQYVRALLPALAQLDANHRYELVLPQMHASTKTLPPNVSVRAEYPLLSRLSANLAKLWFEQIAFARASRLAHAALAHIPYFAPPLFSAARTVVTIHDLIPLLLPAYHGSLCVQAYTRLVSAGARRADAVIADSECSKRDIVRHLGIDAARVHVVYLAAGAEYAPVADLTGIRRKYGLPVKYLLYLGGYDQRKNVRVLIEAFARLSEIYTAGYRLVFAGVNLGVDSILFPNPQRLARQAGLPEGAIQYLGWVDEGDKPALYSGADAFLFASLYEGFGLPPLEAMACGAPVISSSASSLPEVVGDAGLSVSPEDVAGWAEAIRTVLTDDARRATMRERGLARAKEFSWDRAARETLAVYQAAAA
jgi:glycosyltransferase involved in cell wall biosynthesis